jgi:MHS family proline/betaine transporter-like MFS transporter
MAVGNTPRVIAAGAIGNVLEWYDFAVYGYFAAAIGRAFFPQEDKVAQVLAAFGIFAVGFLMRPVGGALIGYIGDRFGRRAALTVSVAAMAIPTFLVGVLPGYQTLGVAAPILLTLLRMIQGLSVGGEYTTSIVFMVEHARPDQRGLIGAMAGCGAVGGILAGSATGAVLAAAMPAEMLQAWGWRIPFLLGLVVGLAGFALRRGIQEEVGAKKLDRSPLLDTLRHHGPLLHAVLRRSRSSTRSFLPDVRLHRELAAVRRRHGAGAGARDQQRQHGRAAAADRGDGWLSDRSGRRPVMLGSIVFAFVGAWPLFWLMHHPDPALVLLGQLGFVLAVGTFIGGQPAVMVEAVPWQVRCTAIALGYNVTLGVVGGLSPLVATWLVARTANDYSPAFMIMAAAAISFLAILTFKETFRTRLQAA